MLRLRLEFVVLFVCCLSPVVGCVLTKHLAVLLPGSPCSSFRSGGHSPELPTIPSHASCPQHSYPVPTTDQFTRRASLPLARSPLDHRLRRGYSLSLKTVGALLRWVFPRTRQKVRARYLDFQHDTIPYLKHRANSRIYRAIIERQNRRSRKPGPNLVGLKPTQRRVPGRPSAWSLYGISGKGDGAKDAVISRSGIFTSSTRMESRGEGYSLGVDGADEGRDRGTRRQKVYSYFKAANELRQAYSTQWAQRNQGTQGSSRDVSGDFSDFEMVRSGEEEMVLFPSYARRHISTENQNDNARDWPDSLGEEDAERPQSQGMEYWESIWHRYQSDNAVVDVDVRGWVYSPHRGPMTRKNRFLITLARKLSGIPAPGQTSSANDESPSQDNLALDRQAESSMKGPSDINENKQSTSLTQDEISAANAQLMDRLRPFLTNPAVGVPATVFFYNDTKSESRTVLTNDGGHFAVRASLDFIPSHIRVLTSENLSATEEVQIIEPNGVSLISDIDDTIKHSAIVNGAKEMFRNTFVRNLADLSVLGVKEWYSRMVDMGVGIHYVSNSPWQLYPLLRNYLNLVGLPPGSVHLKQYSGMLQGIFEPTADRKRPTLERILQDFPDRRFILVGDSGEADLEVYTDLVVANPGRIIAIFIRDVTTPARNGFFDKSVPHLEKSLSREASWNTIENTSDAVDKRPPLPPRNAPQDCPGDADITIGDLIDLEETEEDDMNRLRVAAKKLANNGATPPARPSKPAKLRSGFIETSSHKEPESPAVPRRKAVPPPPVKPRALQLDGPTNPRPNLGASSSENLSTPNTPAPHQHRTREPPPAPPPRRSGSNNLDRLQLAPSNTQLSKAQRSKSSTSLSDRPLNRPPSSSPASTIPTPRTGTPQSLPSSDNPVQLPSKREEAWRRRWARAKEILDRRGVALHSWKTGYDAEDLCAQLVKQTQDETEKGDLKNH